MNKYHFIKYSDKDVAKPKQYRVEGNFSFIILVTSDKTIEFRCARQDKHGHLAVSGRADKVLCADNIYFNRAGQLIKWDIVSGRYQRHDNDHRQAYITVENPSGFASIERLPESLFADEFPEKSRPLFNAEVERPGTPEQERQNKPLKEAEQDDRKVFASLSLNHLDPFQHYLFFGGDNSNDIDTEVDEVLIDGKSEVNAKT